ncbi:MAG: cobalamin-dependent protein [Chloroflexota bacterium]
MTTIASLSDTPKYSIKAVCVQTGIRAVTLRAWERRYNLLTPHRTDSNYRLYSERDVALLRWLKARVDSGMSISSAAAELVEMRENGKWPDQMPVLQPPVPVQAPNPPSQYAERLFRALVGLDEATASAVLAEAHSLFDLTSVCAEIMTPCLVKIGEAWHDGDILISTEHLSSNYLRGRLVNLMQSFPARRAAPRVIMGCAPSEQHEIGMLILAVLLRRDGYRVDYLGANIPAEDLIDYIRAERPALACFTAGSEETARELRHIYNGIAGMRPAVKFGYGGRAFITNPALCETVPGVFLGDTAADAVAQIQQLLV